MLKRMMGGTVGNMGTKEAVHRALVGTVGISDSKFMGQVWLRARRLATERWGNEDVKVKLHGRWATINFANPYPIAVRKFEFYNAPQVELVTLASEHLARPINIIDVGAAVGDTALLILTRCEGAVRRLDCVEGDPEFVRTLRLNLAQPEVEIHEAMLSDVAGPIASLVRSQHAGTASSHGAGRVNATTLDELFLDTAPDVVKTDTDGYDGNILAGGHRLLERWHPAVLFEWHPSLCTLVGTEPLRAFEVLRQAGYDRWVFFTKFGRFSHFGDACLEQFVRLSTTSTTLSDWHYDVVALHPSSPIDEVELADLRHWAHSESK
jgi:FkbM family methyltransferase